MSKDKKRKTSIIHWHFSDWDSGKPMSHKHPKGQIPHRHISHHGYGRTKDTMTRPLTLPLWD